MPSGQGADNVRSRRRPCKVPRGRLTEKMQAEEASERHKRCLGIGVPSENNTPRPETEEWNDWRWQVRNRIRSADGLSSAFGTLETEGIALAASKFPMAITPYYASLIRKFDESDPVYLMSVPSARELEDQPHLVDDPLGEEDDSPVAGLVHRYGDRALVISTSVCAMYCRHCTRKRVTGQKEHCFGKAELAGWVSYLKAHPEVKDVIVSGGDPFTMETDRLDEVLTALRSVDSVETIRIGTRTPVVLPMRIDAELCSMLRKHHPIWVNTHFNHPNEITPEAEKACAMLADAGIPLGNQSVLLKGVNDDPEVMATLCRRLIRMRVRPYYMFQCDLVRGVEHFRTKISDGLRIMEHLRGRVSGIAIPTFVVDLPGGGGKVPVLPDYVVDGKADGETVIFRNCRGELSRYANP